MLSLSINLFLSTLVLMLTAYFVPGFEIGSIVAAAVAVLILGLMNFVIRPILMRLQIPINTVSLGLSTLLLNALIINVAAGMIDGFDVKNWQAALFGASVLTFLELILNRISPLERKHRNFTRRH